MKSNPSGSVGNYTIKSNTSKFCAVCSRSIARGLLVLVFFSTLLPTMRRNALALIGWRVLGASALCFLLIVNGALVAAMKPQISRNRSTTAARQASGFASAPARIEEAVRARIKDTFGKLPLRFEENQGQADPKVKFISRGPGYSLFLAETEAVLTLTEADASADITSRMPEGNDLGSEMVRAMPPLSDKRQAKDSRPDVKSKKSDPQSAVLRMKLSNANLAPSLSGRDELPDRASYYIGSKPKNWSNGARNFEKVEYKDVYPGIDMIYYGNQGQLEYDFNVTPGADPSAITLSFNGADLLRIDQQGALVIRVGDSEIRQLKPVIYQELFGIRKPVSGHYLLKGDSEVGFQVDNYDLTKTLVIDPVVNFGTYLGGSGADSVFGLAVDAAGNVYTAGFTNSLDFPTVNASQPAYAGGTADVVVSKLSPDLSQLLYSTYLGGSGDDRAMGLDVDQAGNAYITGFTSSPNFPAINAMQTAFGGIRDVFAAKLDSGGALVYSTYIGRNGDDRGNALAVDASGNVAIVGLTNSTTFPMMNAFQSTFGGSPADVFVLKLNAVGSALLYSSYLGGSASAQPIFGELVNGIRLDSAGNIYLTGFTESNNFPTKSALQPNFGGGTRDVFLAKFDPSRSGADSLVYSTYLGGSDRDEGNAVTVDSAGNAYVSGFTFSTNFPTMSADQPTLAGGADTFVSKVNANGRSFGYSTYLGGTNNEQGTDIEVDQQRGKLIVAGGTTSSNFAVPLGSGGESGGEISPAEGESEPCCGFGVGKLTLTSQFRYEYRSSNKGLTNTNVNAIDGQGDQLIVGHDAGADKSTDGGGTWSPTFSSPTPVRDVEYNVSLIEYLIISSGDSIFRSRDSGNTWQNHSDGLPGGAIVKDIGGFFFSNYALINDGDLYLDGTGRWEKVETPGGAKVKEIVADAAGDRGSATLIRETRPNEVYRFSSSTFSFLPITSETDEISKMATGCSDQASLGWLFKNSEDRHDFKIHHRRWSNIHAFRSKYTRNHSFL